MTVTHLESIADLDRVLQESADHPVFLFKHSTRCPISFAADSAYLQFAKALPDDADVLCTHLDLIRYRDVSNTIAERLDVTHQSPQAILVVDGQAVWHDSHGGITKTSLQSALDGVAS